MRLRPAMYECGVYFEFDTLAYCDDTAALAWDRVNLERDLRGLMGHFESFGLILHRGHPNTKSKTVAMVVKKKDADSSDGIDLSNIIIDPYLKTFVPFLDKTKVLGSIFTPDLTLESTYLSCKWSVRKVFKEGSLLI